MATHSSVLAWRSPWTEEPGGLQSIGSHRVGHDRAPSAACDICGLPWWCSGKETTCQAGDLGSIPGSERSPGEGNGSPLWYSCLEKPWTEEPSRLQPLGSQESDAELANKTTTIHPYIYIYIYIYIYMYVSSLYFGK